MNYDNERSIWSLKAADDIPNLFRRFNAETNSGNYELYGREFAYSIIFGNLRTANLQTILRVLEISRLPNIMFLIQMDNHHKMYASYPEFSYYPYKAGVVHALQARLKKKKIENVISRFLGHWTIAAFLHLDGKSIADEETKSRVAALASDLISYVDEKTNESISIGISDFCVSHAQFPRAYSECKTALSFSFLTGKQSVEIFDRHKQLPAITKTDLTRVYFTHLTAMLDKCDADACRAIAEEMVDRFRSANVAHITARLLIARLFGRIADYYTESGLEQGELSLIAQDSVIELLDCGFLGEMSEIIIGFCERISKLNSGSRQSPEERFRRHVNDCIERHSSDCLFGLGAIAAMCNYSPSYFSRLFSRVYGIPFSQYLAGYRVDRSKKLLMQESMTLHEVARKAGFCSTSYFCSVFKKKTGKSPRQYAQ
ncbi:MAG: helix-turn-helix transcriptional regulator [Oscillospiraceae bacterium]|nr:helix-turn-helix transcriptional regulator [Oscillospiraceae bacterium]